jgi:predicted TIM-barrel fold metal-dependent hydrolase
MEPTFADIPIVDGHIHFDDQKWMPDILHIMDTVPLARVNLVSTPNIHTVNQNPAVIQFKAAHPDRAYISGGLDYVQVMADPDHMSSLLANQVRALRAIGFDGLKLIEGKPTARKRFGIPLDAPEYEGMWSTLEELRFPMVFHLGDPEEFWDPDRVPDLARTNGWFYGDGTFPTKEGLHTEVDHILERHPSLKIIFAHFYFLSADLERAGRFLDAHPSVCFDLTPGSEMYNNLTRTHEATRRFFLRYQDRLVYGTDTSMWAIRQGGIERPLSYARVVRTFLETDRVFTPPAVIAHWLQPGLDGLHGIALPRQVLDKIYHANFERMYGPAPAALDGAAASAEMERIAGEIDVQAAAKADPDVDGIIWVRKGR